MSARGTRLLLSAGLVALPALTLADPPDFSGAWRLDPKRSDDARSRIEAVAGSEQVKGGGASGLTILPESNTRSEVERVELRKQMLDAVAQLERLEIHQGSSEIKLYQGEEGLRIFYFDREHVRESAQGQKLKCRTRWQGEQLVLEEEGEKGLRLVEVLTLLPSRRELIHAVRFESSLLKDPLNLRLMYRREASSPR